jgi:hypothetical protein
MVSSTKVTVKKVTGKKSAAAKMGRPSAFTQQMADKICELIASGKSQRSISEMPGMPSAPTVQKWQVDREDFLLQYAHARSARADRMAEEIIEIADDGLNDTYVDDQGNVKVAQDVVARSKLRVDARKWLASKMAPKKYGDKIETTLKGDAEAPIKIDVTLSPDEYYLRMIGK